MAQADSTRACQRRLCVHVDAFLGAGFAGVRVDDVVEQPVWLNVNGRPVRDSTLSLYTRTTRWDWRPALSTGVLIGFWPEDGVGLGVGGHVAFVDGDDNITRPYPAATVHIGKLGLQVYGGYIWTPSDPVVLPGDAEAAYLPPGLTRETFLVRGGQSGLTGTLFFGVVVGQAGVDRAHAR
jgi:hypothetical protein